MSMPEGAASAAATSGAAPAAPAAAPAPAAAEPTPAPAAPAAEPQPPVVDPTDAPPPGMAPATEEPPPAEPPVEEPPPPAFPSHEDFGWNDWDGSTLDNFPEELRPWLQAALGRVGDNHKKALKEQSDAAERWQRMFDSVSSGEEDPRIAEAQAETAAAMAKRDEAIAAFDKLAEQLRADAERQSDRYVNWFAHTHPDVVKDETRFEAMADLSEQLGLEWHQTLEVQALGSAAIEEAIKRTEAGKDIEDTLELLKLKHANKPKPKADPQVETSQHLASDDQRPPPPPRPAPHEGRTGDLNSDIKSVVSSVLAKAKRPAR